MRESFLHAAWRTLIFILGLLVLGASLYVLLQAAGVVPPLFYSIPGGGPLQERTLVFGLNLSEQPTSVGLIWMGASVLGLCLGLALLTLAAARERGAGRQVVLRTRKDGLGYGGGELTVSMHSLQALVAATAERVEGVREVHSRLRLKRKGWRVRCDVALAPSTSLPEVASALKPRLQEALEHHTGLPVERVNIMGRLHLKDAHRRVR